MRKVVLCDIDHTVADAAWRDHLIGGPGGWDAYHEAGEKDGANPEMVSLVRALGSDFSLVGLTARPEKWRMPTLAWLYEKMIFFDQLLMRPDNNFDPSPVVKLAMAKREFGEFMTMRVAFLLEDRTDVCDSFRREGVVCLQVHLHATPAPSVPFGKDIA